MNLHGYRVLRGRSIPLPANRASEPRSLKQRRQITKEASSTLCVSRMCDSEMLASSHTMQRLSFNVLTEHRGVRTSLITTAGFRDILEIACASRPDFFNSHGSSRRHRFLGYDSSQCSFSTESSSDRRLTKEKLVSSRPDCRCFSRHC